MWDTWRKPRPPSPEPKESRLWAVIGGGGERWDHRLFKGHPAGPPFKTIVVLGGRL